MGASVEFCLLGPLVVRRGGVNLAVPGGKPRAVLAALLLEAGHLVTAGQLTEVLWGADPPPSARVTLQNHVKGQIGVWKYPRWIEFRDDLPKTATGKIQRYKLREA